MVLHRDSVHVMATVAGIDGHFSAGHGTSVGVEVNVAHHLWVHLNAGLFDDVDGHFPFHHLRWWRRRWVVHVGRFPVADK